MASPAQGDEAYGVQGPSGRLELSRGRRPCHRALAAVAAAVLIIISAASEPVSPPPPTAVGGKSGGGAAEPQPVGDAGGWTLRFADEFNSDRLDLTKWRPNWLAGNDTDATKPVNSGEVSCYDPSQVKEDGGVLTIQAVARSCIDNGGRQYPYASGLIESYGHFTFIFGYIEARIFVTRGSGAPPSWPAFWADGTGPWPTTGELDVMELLGGNFCYRFHSLLGSLGNCPNIMDNSGWHTFGANWQKGVVTYYYDGVQVGSIYDGITHTPMYLIANLGVAAESSSRIETPSMMQIDYIRVWQ